MSATLSAQPSPSAGEEAGRARPTAPSGRLLLRMTPGLHGELARAAEQQGTSLNGYIIACLTRSRFCGAKMAERRNTPYSSKALELKLDQVL